MSLRIKRKRRGASITSLIDVIFLLLLFFMLASTFSKRAEIELASTAEGRTGSEAPDNMVRLLVLTDGIEINGRPAPETTLASGLGEELSEPDSVIIVELSDGVTTQRLIDVLLLLRAIPGARIHIMEPS